jgi:hypothetical protein
MISHQESLLRNKLFSVFSPSSSPKKPKGRKNKKRSPRKRKNKKVINKTVPSPTHFHEQVIVYSEEVSKVQHAKPPQTERKVLPFESSIPTKTATKFQGDGFIKVETTASTKVLNKFTAEAIICLSPGNIKIRKHSGVSVDQRGEFKCWSCCQSKDDDPFSFCPKWTGKGLKVQKGQVLLEHESFKLSTTTFTVFHLNGSTTTLNDFYIPVDRFVFLVASFDGSYARLYINGKLMSAKCFSDSGGSELASKKRKEESKIESENKNQTESHTYLTVGKGFVGMMSYVRVFDRALSNDELSKAMHPWFLSQKNDERAPDVIVPQNREGEQVGLLIDLSICETTNFTHVPVCSGHEKNVNATSPMTALLIGNLSFVIYPNLFFGQQHIVAKGHRRFGWTSFNKLCEQLRSFGSITLTIFVSKGTGQTLETANQLLSSFASQPQFKDWVIRQVKKETGNVNVSLTYFDIDGVEQTNDLYLPEILQSIEAVVRSATTKTDLMLHQHLRNTFRSSLWSKEFGSGHAEMTFKQIFRSLEQITGSTFEELMHHQHSMLPERQTRATTRITKMQFEEGLWVAGMLAFMPEITNLASQLGNKMIEYRSTAALQLEEPSLPKIQTNTSKNDDLLSMYPQIQPGCLVDLAPDKLVSYTVTAKWKTPTIKSSHASLEISATMDLLCVALDGKNTPLETTNVLNMRSADNSVRCIHSHLNGHFSNVS